MDTRTASLFFAILCLLALAGTAFGLVLVIGDRLAPGGALSRLRDDVRPLAMPLAAIVAATTMLGSLYFSEIAGAIPCKLCWLQRICSYPLAVLLPIAAFRRDVGFRLYATVLAGIGIVISTYHSWIQWFPPAGGTSFCTTDAPCTEKWVDELGFVTLPFMAWTCFAAVLVAMLVLGRPADPADLAHEPANDLALDPEPS